MLFVFGTPSIDTMFPEMVIPASTSGTSSDRIDIKTENLATGMYGGIISASNGKLLMKIGKSCVNRAYRIIILKCIDNIYYNL